MHTKAKNVILRSFLIISLSYIISVPLFAQLAPASLTFQQRFNPAAVPYWQDIAVTGSGTPSVGSCAFVSGPDNLCNNIHTFTDANTVHVTFDESTADYAIGAHQATIPITLAGGACAINCTATINFTVGASTVTPAITSISGTFVGCSNTSSVFADPDTCPIPNVRPGGTYNIPATPGTGYYVDSTLGGVSWPVTNVLSDLRVVDSDSIGMVVNADHTIVVTQSLRDGAIYFTKTDGSGDSCLAQTPTDNIVFDPRTPNKYYYLPQDGSVTIQQGTICSAVHSAVITYTGGGGATKLTCSGDGKISKNGYWALIVVGAGTIIMADLNLGTYVSRNYTSELIGNNPRGAIANSPGFSELTGKMWVNLQSNPPYANEFYSWLGPGNPIVNEGPQPFSPNNVWANSFAHGVYKVQPTIATDCTVGGLGCRSTQHADFVEIRVGGKLHEMYFEDWGLSNPTRNWMILEDLDVGVSKMQVDVAFGGGMYGLFLVGTINDTHNVCAAFASACLSSTDADPGIAAYIITGITTGATTTITVASTSGLANGNVLLMNDVGGVPELAGVNKACTVASLTGTTLVCSGFTTSGTWTASTGSFTVDTTPATTHHQAENIFFDVRNPLAPRVIRILQHRSWGYSDRFGTSTGYYGQPHPVLDIFGMFTCYATNAGIPDYYHVRCGPTGFALGDVFLGGNVTAAGKVTMQ